MSFFSLFDRSTRVGSLFGIPIRLHITILFFLWPALTAGRFQFVYGLEYAAGIVLSILIHELGHALTAKSFGLKGLSITLHGFGGFAVSDGRRTPRQDLLIVLAGPAATFALGILCALIGRAGERSTVPYSDANYQFYLLHYLGSVNLMLGCLNMIPCLPWDGGQALRAILAHRISEYKATRYTAHLGLVLAPILFIAGLIYRVDYFGLFALVGFLTCYQLLARSGGIRFGEYFADRRHRKEMEAVEKREREKVEAYLGDVREREREREERERLRKILGED